MRSQILKKRRTRQRSWPIEDSAKRLLSLLKARNEMIKIHLRKKVFDETTSMLKSKTYNTSANLSILIRKDVQGHDGVD